MFFDKGFLEGLCTQLTALGIICALCVKSRVEPIFSVCCVSVLSVHAVCFISWVHFHLSRWYRGGREIEIGEK